MNIKPENKADASPFYTGQHSPPVNLRYNGRPLLTLSWLADKELGELGLRQEGVVVLGIQRKNGRYVGAPKGHTRICSGDTLILYGRLPLLNELDQRGADWTGEQSHQQAVAQQQRNLAQQNREEAAENL